MEFRIVEETPKTLVAEVRGAGHTLCNALKASLYGNKHVKIAAYSISHPLVGIPTIMVETDGTVKPKKALAEAASKLADATSKLRKEFRKIK